MRLTKQIASWVAAHIGFSMVQLVLLFLVSDVASYGGALGFLAHTPFKDLVPEAGVVQAVQVDENLLSRMFDSLVNVGNTLFGMMSFNYGFLTGISSSDGFVYWVLIAIRVGAWVSTLAAGEALAEVIFSSGILQSTIGAALVMGGVGIGGALTALGIFA